MRRLLCAGLAWLLSAAAGPTIPWAVCPGAERTLCVSPAGDDRAAGTPAAPLRTLFRAQQAARALAKQGPGDVVVSLAPGEYRLERTLRLTEADSGPPGHRTIYRSAAGPGQARLLGSVELRGWQAHRDGIWKVRVAPGLRFHTLYENGRRAWKARFPNHEDLPDFPTARGRYLRSQSGCRELQPGQGKRGDGWLVYRAEDAPPVTDGRQMRVALFDCGKSDWMRCIYPVRQIDPLGRRIVFCVDELPYGNLANEKFRVLGDARFFLEDALGLLDAPGEFLLDETAGTLYYKPRRPGHPDTLRISAPVVDTLVRVEGSGREACACRLRLEGLSLEETNDFPRTWWNCDYGRADAALLWLRNCRGVEIAGCRLRNGGRSGIMFIGYNVENRVERCAVEGMGVNGITLSNRFLADDGQSPTPDCCRGNAVEDCHIHHIGQIHCYAACIDVFNASDNRVSHCQLDNSVRYAVTLRGNTNAQHVLPHVFNNLPKCRGNVFDHLDIHHCGQDSGDMGAVHAANLNIPGGDAVNTFQQIVVADMRACPSMHDLPPDGIFLDWPSKAMHQVFRDFQVVRVAGKQLRSHKPENGDSAVTENVSWKPGFQPSRMDYEHIGLTADFPAAYGGRTAARHLP